jgi:hypothetical protein
MSTTRYEIVEKDKEARDSILSTLVENPTQGVAFLFLMAGEPMSAAEMVEFLSLSDSWFTQRFNNAVAELAGKGLIREAGDEDG